MRKSHVAALIGMLAVGSAAQAQVSQTPVYPAPGGNTFSSVGSAGTAAGQERAYGGFDGSQFSQLYWTFTAIQNPYYSGPGGTGPTGSMKLDVVSGNYARWISTAPVTIPLATGGSFSQFAYFEAYLQPYAPGSNSGPCCGTVQSWMPAAAAGINTLPSNWPVFNVAANPGYSFDVWNRYVFADGSAILDRYNSLQTYAGGSLVTSSSGGFYAAPPVTATPEPATLALMATGFVGVVGIARRRKRQENA